MSRRPPQNQVEATAPTRSVRIRLVQRCRQEPEMARKMANDAESQHAGSTVARRAQNMPGTYACQKAENKKTNSSNSSYSKPKKKKSKVSQRDLKPKNGPLKITRTKVSRDTPKQAQVGSTKQSSAPSPSNLQDAFRTMERSDGLGRYNGIPDQGTIDQLNALGQQYRAYLASQPGRPIRRFFLNIGFDLEQAVRRSLSAPLFCR